MPINVAQQVEYWLNGSSEDIEAAAILLTQRKIRHALFFAHLSVEKALKAHVVRATGDLPPRTHDLLRLAERTSLQLSPGQRSFMASFQQHCLEGRYPDSPSTPISDEQARAEMTEAQGALQWLRQQLK